MTSARHAADAHDEIQRLRLTLQTMCERSMLGISPTSAELDAAFRGASLTEYHACRTMVAIDCGARRGSDRDLETPDRRAFSAEGAR